MAAPAARESYKRVLDLPEIQEPEDLGLVERIGQTALGEHIGKVHDGPCGAGDRDGVDEDTVLVDERSRGVNDRARVPPD